MDARLHCKCKHSHDGRTADGETHEITVRLSVWSVPASINERQSSGNVAVQESRDVTITCSVFGIPQPEITWYRRARAGRLSDAVEQQCHLVTGMSN